MTNEESRSKRKRLAIVGGLLVATCATAIAAGGSLGAFATAITNSNNHADPYVLSAFSQQIDGNPLKAYSLSVGVNPDGKVIQATDPEGKNLLQEMIAYDNIDATSAEADTAVSQHANVSDIQLNVEGTTDLTFTIEARNASTEYYDWDGPGTRFTIDPVRGADKSLDMSFVTLYLDENANGSYDSGTDVLTFRGTMQEWLDAGIIPIHTTLPGDSVPGAGVIHLTMQVDNRNVLNMDNEMGYGISNLDIRIIGAQV